MNLDLLKHLQEKPALFSPGDPLFWDDPHISAQMIKAHLDPSHDLASRRPEIIDKSVDWLIEILELNPGTTLLDLGCGPGLYASRFARRGIQVTGIDFSRRSIDYAEAQAKGQNLDICYRYQNYLDLEDTNLYDVALLIYGDFCPLAPEQRSQLLQNLRRALKPGGAFVLDVSTPIHRQKHGSRNGWYVAETGFWKPGPHLVLETGFNYPEVSIFLDQAIVMEEDSKISVYRMWFQDYTRGTIIQELERGDFAIQSVWSDLTGTPYTVDTEWIGLITRNK